MSWLSTLVLLSLLGEGVPPGSVADVPADEAAQEARGYMPLIHLDLPLWSTYVWRGEGQYQSVSTPSFQPELTIEFPGLGPGTLGLDIWTAFSMARADYRPENGLGSEIDLALRYDMSLLGGWLELGVGFVYYIYPHAESADGEKELIVEIGLGNLPISISLITFTQLSPQQGIYLEPTFGWEQEFGQVTVGMDISLAASVYNSEEASLQHATLGVNFDHAVGRMSLSMNLSYSLRLAPGAGSFFERSLIYGAVGFSVDVTTPRGDDEEPADQAASAMD